jgi:Ca2+-binding RTX toxin-like protein
MDTNGVEHIGIATHAGTDTVTVNDLAGTGVTNVDVTGDSPNVVAAGTAADDAFTVGGNSVTAFGTAITSTGTITVDGRDGNDTTTVEGTESADSITLAAATPAVAIGPTVRTLTENIRVNGNGGDDVITAGNGLATLASLTLDGGAGNDRIVGGDGADVLVGGDGTDTVAGGRGNDTALLGAGDDSFTWDPGDGSDAVEGGAGADTLQFNGSNANEQMELSADGRRLRFARDIAAVTMDTNGVEHIGIETRAGTDSVTVNDLAGTGVADVDVTGDSPNVIAGGTPADDSFVFSGGALQAFGTALTSTGTLTADGRGGNDTTTVQGTDNADTISIAGASPAVAVSPNLRTLTESLVVDGNGGDDTIAAQNGLATLTSLTINGGDGNDTLTGGDGNDLIDAGNGNDIVDGGRGNDTALLGAGDDSFTWDPGDASDTVEGGDGDDTLVFNGSNANEQIDLGANGSRLRLTRDIAAVTMDTAGVEQVDIATKGGTDTVTVHDLTGTGATATAVHVDLGSDGQADQVVVFGTDAEDVIGAAGSAGAVTVTGARAPVQLAGADPIDAVVIDALGDDDVVNGSGLAADTAHLVADGGEGDDVLVGGDGDDTLLGGPGDDVLNGGPGQDVLDGGTGSNVLIQG